jgi:hypothetical protein
MFVLLIIYLLLISLFLARDHLIYKRNRRMGARVIELLINNPGTSYFFAFGAGHFVGENTVIDVVRNAGSVNVIEKIIRYVNVVLRRRIMLFMRGLGTGKEK